MNRQYHPRPLANLSGTQMLILDELCYLSKGGSLAMPSRAYLAAKVGASIVTVSRHVSRLAKLGYLTRTQRRPKDGIYRTNLYRLNQLLTDGPRRLIASLQAALHRVSGSTHHHKRYNYKNDKNRDQRAKNSVPCTQATPPRFTRPPDIPMNAERALAELAKIRVLLACPSSG